MPQVIAAAILFLALTGTALASGGNEGFVYHFVLFLHQILFVFWLGPDIGVYMWSTKLTNPEVTPAQRVAAARIMNVIDVLPKVCMSLMLTVGGVLTELKGIEHPWWQMIGIYLLGPVWLGLTLTVYMQERNNAASSMASLDKLFRWVVIVTVVASALFSVVTGRLADYPWVTGKLFIFAAVVFFGLMLRARLAPIGPAVDQMESSGPTPELDATIKSSMGQARVFMIATWIALAMAAGLGMAQPGSPDELRSVEIWSAESR